MNQILLNNITYSFGTADAIISNCTLTLNSSIPNIIKGKNGSGKSTLLQLILGLLSPQTGTINYEVNQQSIVPEKLYQHFSYAAPSIQLIDSFTVMELLNWLSSLRRFYSSPQEIITAFGLQKIAHKRLRNLSSGMYQRIKLLQAFFCTSDFLLLDEPCSNFDQDGYALYRRLCSEYSYNRLVIIASNDEQEFYFSHNEIWIEQLKSEPSSIK